MRHSGYSNLYLINHRRFLPAILPDNVPLSATNDEYTNIN